MEKNHIEYKFSILSPRQLSKLKICKFCVEELRIVRYCFSNNPTEKRSSSSATLLQFSSLIIEINPELNKHAEEL